MGTTLVTWSSSPSIAWGSAPPCRYRVRCPCTGPSRPYMGIRTTSAKSSAGSLYDDEPGEVTVPQIWAGVGIGKEHHHCVVVNEHGERLLSRRVFNDEPALLELIADVLALSEDALWAVAINHGGAALLIGLLLSHEQPMVYITGLAVHQASTATADSARRTRRTRSSSPTRHACARLGPLRPGDEIAVNQRTLTARRLDLVNDRTRQTDRLRAQLLCFFPALERALNLSKKSPVVLLTGHQVPPAIRRSGVKRIGTWCRSRWWRRGRGRPGVGRTAGRDRPRSGG
ncbi:transposase [Streptomyces sp. NPDC017988]|uniref:IS110 family transposase n=1 Tax=Streptomyces sp. NPDC017988 TaxID=3365025 RepID=UPI0037BB3ADE